LDQGAKAHIGNNHQRTPLHIAAAKGHADMVKALIKHGAVIGAKDNNERTSMHEGVIKGNRKVVEVLLENGGDITEVFPNGVTLIDQAQDEGYGEVVNVLRKYGAKPKAKVTPNEQIHRVLLRFSQKDQVSLIGAGFLVIARNEISKSQTQFPNLRPLSKHCSINIKKDQKFIMEFEGGIFRRKGQWKRQPELFDFVVNWTIHANQPSLPVGPFNSFGSRNININEALQQNLWVTSGSGNAPSV